MIEQEVLQRVLGAALRTGGEFAEVFAEDKRSSSAVLDDGKVEELTSGRDRGAGIRVVVGDTTGFAHTADLSEAGLARRGRGGGRRGPGRRRRHRARSSLTRQTSPAANDVEIHPGRRRQGHARSSCSRRADESARSRRAAPSRQVSASYGDSRRRILVANTDGLLADDDQVRTLFAVSVRRHRRHRHADRAARRIGHTVGFELFDRYDVEELARRAASRALTKLDARPAPSGQMPVVIGTGGGGVLFHEACGHGLEADLVAKGASVFARPRRRAGRQSPLVTLVDDGTMAERVGRHRHRRRGPPRPAQRADRGRRAHRLHVGLPAGPQGGPAPRRATAGARATSTCRWCA